MSAAAALQRALDVQRDRDLLLLRVYAFECVLNRLRKITFDLAPVPQSPAS